MAELGRRAIDLTGQRFGSLVAETPAGKNAHGAQLWNCGCDCGGRRTVKGGDLKIGKVISCGCRNIVQEPADIAGQRFGRWTALSRIQKTTKGNTKWRCRCDCGTESEVYLTHLTGSKSLSCGCHARDVNRTHGLSGTLISQRHRAMLSRCYYPKHKRYHDYGGRGITVCAEWHDLATFAAWADESGFAPELELDRIDPNGNYEPGNCRWITHYANMQNMRRSVKIVIAGETLSLSEAAIKYRVNKFTLRGRLNNGIPPELAVRSSEEIYGPNTRRRARSGA